MSAKILTIDDSKTMRSIIKKQITTLGYDPLEAADGAEGIDVAAAQKPDLILLDVTMPVMDGKQALLKLRQLPETSKIPVIMVTAEASKTTVLEIIKAGVSDYIVKPFNETVLGEKIKKVLSSASTSAVERTNILLVDGNEATSKSFVSALQAEHNIQVAASGDHAFDLLLTHQPHMIFIDSAMPDTIRLQLAEKLKGAGSLARLVAICSKSSADEAARASQKGFSGILLKPYIAEEARAIVSNIIQIQTQFASRKGTLVVLRYPTKDEINLYSVFRLLLQGWQNWLSHLAALGIKKLIVDVAQAASIGVEDLRFFRELAGKAGDLGFRIVFVIGEPKTFELKHFWESQATKSAVTLDDAKRLIEAA